MQKWVFGGYTLQIGLAAPKVELNAALGLVEWQPGETIKEVLARADALMYKQKSEAHKQTFAVPGAQVN
jgi:PleD family two-component response regulator